MQTSNKTYSDIFLKSLYGQKLKLYYLLVGAFYIMQGLVVSVGRVIKKNVRDRVVSCRIN